MTLRGKFRFFVAPPVAGVLEGPASPVLPVISPLFPISHVSPLHSSCCDAFFFAVACIPARSGNAAELNGTCGCAPSLLSCVNLSASLLIPRRAEAQGGQERRPR